MSTGARLIELIDRPWNELSEDEQDEFARWLAYAGAPVNLYTLLRYARRGRSSSSTKIMAVRGEPPDDR